MEGKTCCILSAGLTESVSLSLDTTIEVHLPQSAPALSTTKTYFSRLSCKAELKVKKAKYCILLACLMTESLSLSHDTQTWTAATRVLLYIKERRAPSTTLLQFGRRHERRPGKQHTGFSCT